MYTITKLGQMVLKGVNWVYNDKLGHIVLCTQCIKSENLVLCIFMKMCMHFASNLHKMHAFSENVCIFHLICIKCVRFWKMRENARIFGNA